MSCYKLCWELQSYFSTFHTMMHFCHNKLLLKWKKKTPNSTIFSNHHHFAWHFSVLSSVSFLINIMFKDYIVEGQCGHVGKIWKIRKRGKILKGIILKGITGYSEKTLRCDEAQRKCCAFAVCWEKVLIKCMDWTGGGSFAKCWAFYIWKW